MKSSFWLLGFSLLIVAGAALAHESNQPKAADDKKAAAGDEQIDFDKARDLLRKRQGGEKLTADEAAYLARAMAARAAGKSGKANQADNKAGKKGQAYVRHIGVPF